MEPGQIVLYVVGAIALTFWIRRRMLSASIPQCSEEEAVDRARSGKAILVDVRTGHERSRRTLQGSLHLPLQEIGQIEKRFKPYKDREIIFFCASGTRSISAALRARKLGFTVSNLRGGIG